MIPSQEVFFLAGEHQSIVAEKKRLLREYEFEGVDLLDTELAFSDDDAKPDRAHNYGELTSRRTRTRCH
jgi:hypothetical protein